MSVGLYLSFTFLLFLVFALWLRGLVVRRLQPERVLADLEQEIRALIAEINQAGDHNISLLEDRITQLTDLIGRSDRQIDDARLLLDFLESRRIEPGPVGTGGVGTGGVGTGGAGTGGGEPVVSRDAVMGESTTVSRDTVMDERIVTSRDGAAGESTARRDAARDESTTGGDSAGPGDARESVLELYRQGLSHDLIAVRTGVAPGEVELIISLRGKRVWR